MTTERERLFRRWASLWLRRNKSPAARAALDDAVIAYRATDPLDRLHLGERIRSAAWKLEGEEPPPLVMLSRARSSGNINHPSGLTVRNARLTRARPFEWAWDGRIVLANFNLMVGEEGIGKGTLVAWIAAQVTRGTLPGNLAGSPRRVVIVGDEDSWDHIWVPRLKAVGAKLTLVKQIVYGEGGTFDVREDADALRTYIEDEEIALVYFDQLLDNLGYTNNWQDKQVRDALSPLRAVAQETGAAVLASMHPNKRGGSFRDRISGTPAFNAIARSSLYAAPHPSEPGRTVLVRGKGNYGPEPLAFEFRIEEHHLEIKARKTNIVVTTSRVASERETKLRRDDVLDGKASNRLQEDSQAGKARRLLSEEFADGKPRKAKAVRLGMYATHGLRGRVVTEAATQLGFRKWQEGFPGVWWWGPPEEGQDSDT